MPNPRALGHAFVLAALFALSAPTIVLAQEPVDHPPDFAALRDRFEDMSRDDWEAAGYRVIPPGACIAAPAGGMGVHAINPALHDAQFGPSELDPENPR